MAHKLKYYAAQCRMDDALSDISYIFEGFGLNTEFVAFIMYGSVTLRYIGMMRRLNDGGF